MTIETRNDAGLNAETARRAPRPAPSEEADPAMPLQLTCPNCGATDLVMEQGARFCEECGYGVDEPVTGEEEPSEYPAPSRASPAAAPRSTPRATAPTAGTCSRAAATGWRWTSPWSPASATAVCATTATRTPWRCARWSALDGRNLVVAVVCDGVSTSERPDEASAAAVSAAAKLLLTAIAAGTPTSRPPGRTPRTRHRPRRTPSRSRPR